MVRREDEMDIYGVKLPLEDNEEVVSQLMGAISTVKRERIRRFVKREDSLRTLMADILSRLAICRRLNIKNSEIELNFNRYGKPLLQGNETLHFNNTHSVSWAVSAISSVPIGVDMEQIGEVHLEIAERFFSPQEYNDLLLHKEGEARQKYFFDLWTLKESYIKATGMGLYLSLSSFTIRKNNERIELNTQNEFKVCYFRQYAIDPDYRLSLCAANDSFPDHVTLLSFEEMTQAFLEYM